MQDVLGTVTTQPELESVLYRVLDVIRKLEGDIGEALSSPSATLRFEGHAAVAAIQGVVKFICLIVPVCLQQPTRENVTDTIDLCCAKLTTDLEKCKLWMRAQANARARQQYTSPPTALVERRTFDDWNVTNHLAATILPKLDCVATPAEPSRCYTEALAASSPASIIGMRTFDQAEDMTPTRYLAGGEPALALKGKTQITAEHETIMDGAPAQSPPKARSIHHVEISNNSHPVPL